MAFFAKHASIHALAIAHLPKLEHPAPKRALDYAAEIFTTQSGHRLPYRLFSPAPGEGPVPLVLFLHGAFERGTDNSHQLDLQTAPMVFSDPKVQQRFPCYVLAPQCPEDQQWVEALRKLGGEPIYTEYPAALKVDHGSWNPAYTGTPDQSYGDIRFMQLLIDAAQTDVPQHETTPA